MRHGQSTKNAEKRIQGWIDDPLTEQGVRQAGHAAAKLLEYQPIDVLYSSSLKRAFQTATIIGERVSLRPVPRDDLREIYGGRADGLNREELMISFPGLVERWLSSDDTLQLPGGELVGRFFDRVVKALWDIVDHHQTQRVVVVTHGGVLSAWITQLAEGRPTNLWTSRFHNCDITEVELQGREAKSISINGGGNMESLST